MDRGRWQLAGDLAAYDLGAGELRPDLLRYHPVRCRSKVGIGLRVVRGLEGLELARRLRQRVERGEYRQA